jgi:chromosome segregation ATPase
VATQPIDASEYEQKRIALTELRQSLLSQRLTYSVVQTRLREAAIEEAEQQIAHLQERQQALAPAITTTTRQVAELTAEVQRLHVNALTRALEQAATQLTGALVTIDTQVRALCAELPAAIALAERAQEYANNLPALYIRERVAANEAAERLRAMEDVVRLLCFLIGEEAPPDRHATAAAREDADDRPEARL